MALWESQLAQLGLAAASCVARCEQLPEYTAQGRQLKLQACILLASVPLESGRVRGPEQTLSLGFIGGFSEVEGALKIVKNHMWLCIVLGRGRKRGHNFPHLLKEGLLIPEMVKNPGVDPLCSLSPPSLDWGFPAHNVRHSLQPSPQFLNLRT